MVYGKANSVQAATVDAPSWIHKYIIGRKGANIKQITQDLSKVHVQFTEEEDRITIEGLPEEAERAKATLKELTAEMVHKLTYTTLTVDPKYFKHIIGKNGANVNRLKEQTGVIVNISESDQNVIRIEGSRQGVETVKQELEEMIAKMELEKEKDVIIDWKYHRALIGRETKEKFPNVLIKFPPQDQKSDIVKLRGPKDEVDKCHKYLTKIVKELIDNNCIIEVPAQCHKIIIRNGDATIQMDKYILIQNGSSLSDVKKTLLPTNKFKHRYPYCIVWTKISPLTWFLPFLGHVGICTSEGVIRDYPTSFIVLKDGLAYGCPMKIWQLEARNARYDWDRSIDKTVKIYKKLEFDFLFNNCYSMVVYALNEMNYEGKSNWNGLDICLGIMLYGRYVDYSAAVKTLLPAFSIFISIFIIMMFIIFWYNIVLFHLYFHLINISLNFIK